MKNGRSFVIANISRYVSTIQTAMPNSFKVLGNTSEAIAMGIVMSANDDVKMEKDIDINGIQLNASTEQFHDFNNINPPKTTNPKATPSDDKTYKI